MGFLKLPFFICDDLTIPVIDFLLGCLGWQKEDALAFLGEIEDTK
jgi:hypothetical protein